MPPPVKILQSAASIDRGGFEKRWYKIGNQEIILYKNKNALYDLLFYFGIIIIVLNLIFGVIIDTFADLRNEKQKKDDIIRNTCFICGLERRSFDNRSISFETHIQVNFITKFEYSSLPHTRHFDT